MFSRAIPRLAGLALALATLVVACPATSAGGVRAEIPIREIILSDGTRRYALALTVGATPVTAGLDTGSTGLRILPGVLALADAEAGRRSVTYSYGTGVELRGTLGHGRLTLGAPAVSGEIVLHLVRAVGCRADRPDCPAARVPARAYGIEGDGLLGQGFAAIIGLNMAVTDIANPLVQLGVRRWIVELPRPGDTRPGRLILDPSPQETRGYSLIPLDPAFADRRDGEHDVVDACVINHRSGQRLCGPLLMDTGDPGLRIVTRAVLRPWPNGTPVTVAFLDHGKAAIATDIDIGRRDQASRLTTVTNPMVDGPHLYAGLIPYFAFSVLYDPEHGVIGLKAREP